MAYSTEPKTLNEQEYYAKEDSPIGVSGLGAELDEVLRLRDEGRKQIAELQARDNDLNEKAQHILKTLHGQVNP